MVMENISPGICGCFMLIAPPTDNALCITSIPKMRGQSVDTYDSKAQDQHLVAEFADAHGLTGSMALKLFKGERFRDSDLKLFPC